MFIPFCQPPQGEIIPKYIIHLWRKKVKQSGNAKYAYADMPITLSFLEFLKKSRKKIKIPHSLLVVG